MLGAVDRVVEYGRERRRSFGCRRGAFRGPPNHRQHGPFDRTHHRLVGHFLGAGEGLGEVAAVQFVPLLDPAGEAPEDLGENDAGVAAGSHQRAIGKPTTYLGHGLRILADGLDRGLHRHCHVGSGVAIRHRKDVEGVNLLVVRIQPGGGVSERPGQLFPVPQLGLNRGVD